MPARTGPTLGGLRLDRDPPGTGSPSRPVRDLVWHQSKEDPPIQTPRPAVELLEPDIGP
jgi:hypothetical protein